MNKKILSLVFIIIIVFIVLMSLLLINDKSQVVIMSKDKVTVVKTMVAKKIPLNLSIDLLGTILPKYKSKLASLTPGYITKIFVHRGEYVRKEQELALLDSNVLQFDLDDVNAQLLNIKKRILRGTAELKHHQELLKTEEKILTLKEKNLQRYKKLLDKNIVGHSSYESQEQVVLNERAKVRNIKFDLDNTQHDLIILNNQKKQLLAQINAINYKILKLNILAPYDGVIYARKVSIGGHVTAGETLFEIYSEESEIITPMPFQYRAEIEKAFNDNEIITAILDGDVELKLDRISNVINKGKLGRELFFLVKKPRKLVMNSKVKLKVILPKKTVFYIPKNALYQGSKIYVVINNRLQAKIVNKLGVTQVKGESVYAIESNDLKEGEKILISPISRPRQGEIVKVHS